MDCETPAGHLGLMTCYDIRFPWLSDLLRGRGAQMLTYPSAFTVETGAFSTLRPHPAPCVCLDGCLRQSFASPGLSFCQLCFAQAKHIGKCSSEREQSRLRCAHTHDVVALSVLKLRSASWMWVLSGLTRHAWRKFAGAVLRHCSSAGRPAQQASL